MLGNIHDSRVLLGSATPSIESYYNSKISKKLSLVELNERYGNIPLPQLKLINISEKIKEGNMFGLFSDLLLKKLRKLLKIKNRLFYFKIEGVLTGIRV